LPREQAVVVSCVLFDKIRIDDPVGAISVHGVCGAWGTLAVGLFAADVGLFSGGGLGQLGIQAIGVGAALLWAFPVSPAIFHAINATMGLRVSPEREDAGPGPHRARHLRVSARLCERGRVGGSNLATGHPDGAGDGVGLSGHVWASAALTQRRSCRRIS
jgi:hypothetical protein